MSTDKRVITAEKQMWWEAYLASLSGLRAEGQFGYGLDVTTLAAVVVKDADAAIAAYYERWGLESKDLD